MKKRYLLSLVAMAVTGGMRASHTFISTDTTRVVEGREMPEIVVTGTGTEHLLKDAPVETEVISRKQLERFSGQNIEDILASLTSSFSFNQDDMGSQMQMNGLGNSYILVLIDGRRIHGDVGGENDLSLIDPANIEKIEIVRGASSALYGSDAIAGVINIITRRHLGGGIEAENTSRLGSYGDIRQHNGIGLNFGRTASWTNFQLQHSDGWQNTQTEYTTSTEDPYTTSMNKTVNRHTSWQIAERLSFRASKSTMLYAEGTTYWKRIYRPLGKNSHYDVHNYDLTYRNRSLSAGGKWMMNKSDYLTFNAGWNQHAYRYVFTTDYIDEDYSMDTANYYYPYVTYLEGQTQLQSDQQRTIAETRAAFSLPLFGRLVTGLEARYDLLRSPQRVEGGKADDNTEALYIQDEWDGLSWVNVTAGMRLNRNEQFGWRLTPKLSTMIKLGQWWRIRAQWSRGFKTPTLKELNYRYIRQMGGSMYLYLGNTSLRPQKSAYCSLGGEYTRGGLSIGVTAYYNKVTDMISLVKISRGDVPEKYLAQYAELDITPRQYQNIDDAKTCGVDASIDYTHGEWTAGVRYSYLDTRANTYNTSNDKMERIVIDGMAHHKGNWFLSWGRRLTGRYRLSITLYGRVSTKRYYQIDGDGKGYRIWRIATTHTVTDLPLGQIQAAAGIDNILNYVDRTPHGLHLGTTTPGRTVYLSINIHFQKGKKQTKYNFKKQTNNYEED